MKVRFIRLDRLASATRVAVLSFMVSTGADAQQGVVDAGGSSRAQMTMASLAVHSKDHTTLIAVFEAAGLTHMLAETDSFIVFAPTNAAFEKLPAGMFDTLLKPENKPQLAKLLLSHTVGVEALDGFIGGQPWKDSGAQKLTTIGGALLWVTVKEGNAVVQDESGATAKVSLAYSGRSRSAIFSVNHVLIPREPADVPSGWTLVDHDQMSKNKLP
jgi:uncharacterized surface protein with fasciclin (FAS1) repeats